MSHLTGRGLNKSSTYTLADAQAFIDRASDSHNLEWKASSFVYNDAGAEVELYNDLPVVGGTLALDSSDPVRRRLSLEVAVADDPALVPNQPSDPLAPFGQYLKLWTRIDREGGGWFDWIKQGEFPITSFVYEYPSGVATVESTDYAGRVNEYLMMHRRGFKGMKVAHAISDLVREALPNKAYAVDASGDATTEEIANYAADTGTGRWDVATAIAQKKRHECFFDWNGDLVIRPDVTDDNDETIPGNGPDIGTVSNPVATIRDGDNGNLVGMTATVTREGGVNGVRVNLQPAPTKRAKKTKTPADDQVASTPITALQTEGPVTWGNSFGFIPMARDQHVHKVTADVRAHYTQQVRHILHRRRGLTRYLDLDAAGLYWLEPDDKVRVIWDGNSEAHFVQAVTFDLTGARATRVRTRQLNVTDPG